MFYRPQVGNTLFEMRHVADENKEVNYAWLCLWLWEDKTLHFRCQCCHCRSYILCIYADARMCFAKVGVALCKLYPVTDAHT